MPFDYSLYTVRKNKLDEVAHRTTENIRRESQSLSYLLAAKNDLDEMALGSGGNPPPYAGVATEIDTAASENPEVTGYQNQKFEKDEMVSDFAKVRQRVTMRVAVNDAIAAALSAGWTPAQITSAVETALTTD